jgi:hypothetical protein
MSTGNWTGNTSGTHATPTGDREITSEGCYVAVMFLVRALLPYTALLMEYEYETLPVSAMYEVVSVSLVATCVAKPYSP